jgi:hypothetical protein
MSRPSSPRSFRVLLGLLVVTAYLSTAIPRVQAQGCIEYTVWNEQTQRCECPDQWCCDFYWPFIPYGCPDKGGVTAEKLSSPSALFELLQYEPQREISGGEFLRLEFLSDNKGIHHDARITLGD